MDIKDVFNILEGSSVNENTDWTDVMTREFKNYGKYLADKHIFRILGSYLNSLVDWTVHKDNGVFILSTDTGDSIFHDLITLCKHIWNALGNPESTPLLNLPQDRTYVNNHRPMESISDDDRIQSITEKFYVTHDLQYIRR